MFEEFKAEFFSQRPQDDMIPSDPLAAKIDPALSLAAGFLREHSSTNPVAGLQDQHGRALVQFEDFPCRHETGESSANNDDISHVPPHCPRSSHQTSYILLLEP